MASLEEPPRERCAILVLGDLGRSPRMQYHALSLSQQAKMDVDVVCFLETRPRDELVDDPHITVRPIRPFPLSPPSSRVGYLFYGVAKALFQALVLLWMLLVTLPLVLAAGLILNLWRV